MEKILLGIRDKGKGKQGGVKIEWKVEIAESGKSRAECVRGSMGAWAKRQRAKDMVINDL